jgi:hypothetical protein
MADMRRAGEKRCFCLLSHGLSSALTALWDPLVIKLLTGLMETINNSYDRYQEGSFLYQNELLPIMASY